jgi:hypothetical protein
MGKLYVGNSGSTPAIVNVKEVEKTLFGLGYDQWVGVLDENGTLKAYDGQADLNAVGLKKISGDDLFYLRFENKTNIKTAFFPDLEVIDGNRACCGMFKKNTELTRIDLSKLTSVVGELVCYNMFDGCTSLSEANLSNLSSISKNGCSYMFRDCAGLTSVNLSSLSSVEDYGCQYMFQNCVGLTETGIVWPSIIGGWHLYDYMFSGCTGLTSTGLDNVTQLNGYESVAHMFEKCTSLTSTGLDNVTAITGQWGAEYMFSGCTGLTSTGLGNVTVIGSARKPAGGMFFGCTGLISTGLHRLTSITGQYGCEYMFYNCSGLIDAGLDSLTEITNSKVFGHIFYGCTSLTRVDFPMLSVISKTDGLCASAQGMFMECPNLTELHFRKDAQAIIEGQEGYSSKFNAVNATIYFDLIGTITVNDVAYARDEKQSVRIDGIKTFVGWKDVDDNIVYTSYENNTEPTIGTVVYLDAGTTQVGTVEAAA